MYNLGYQVATKKQQEKMEMLENELDVVMEMVYKPREEALDQGKHTGWGNGWVWSNIQTEQHLWDLKLK